MEPSDTVDSTENALPADIMTASDEADATEASAESATAQDGAVEAAEAQEAEAPAAEATETADTSDTGDTGDSAMEATPAEAPAPAVSEDHPVEELIHTTIGALEEMAHAVSSAMSRLTTLLSTHTPAAAPAEEAATLTE
jgi:hypothetical protein